MDNKQKTLLQKEIVDGLESKPKGRLLLAPRIGKTKLMIDLIKREKPKSILWVTPESNLATKDIPEEFETWKAKRFLKKLTTTTWSSLNKIQGHYDMIILDEEQFITENNAQWLLLGTLTYNSLISMTGTPTKHFDKMDIFRRLGLTILYEIPINDAVDMGLLSDYSVKIVHISMSSELNLEAGNKNNRFMTSEKKQYVYLDNRVSQGLEYGCNDLQFRILARMRAIKNSPSKEKVAKHLMDNLRGRKLFYCASIKQADKLCSNTYHSKTNNEDLIKFKNGIVNRIAMVNAGGTGHTYKEIDHLVLVQADSDKNGLTSQKFCRTLLAQKDYKATIWIICLDGTQDDKWISSFLERFDESKVEHIEFKDLKL